MKVTVLPHLSVISKTRTEPNDNNKLIIKTSPNRYCIINVDETIKNINRELKTHKRFGELENFKMAYLTKHT